MSKTNQAAKIFRAKDLAKDKKNIKMLMFVFLTTPCFRFKTLVKNKKKTIFAHEMGDNMELNFIKIK